MKLRLSLFHNIVGLQGHDTFVSVVTSAGAYGTGTLSCSVHD